MAWYEWRPYVPVAERLARGRRALAKRKKKGQRVEPVEVRGRTIARTFWGRAWCDHLEKFSDFANRLPRGRTYVRNGSVGHLEIAGGVIRAVVFGSELYDVRVTIKKLPASRWRTVKSRCAGGIATLLELLEGRLSEGVMSVVTDRDRGLFPLPREIAFECSCPDWAVMCKHVAAVLYGVGARLDQRPELLFGLRGVDHEELIAADPTAATVVGKGGGGRRRIAGGDLAEVFDIDLVEADGGPEPHAAGKPRAGARRKSGGGGAAKGAGPRGRAARASAKKRRFSETRATGAAGARRRSFTGASVVKLRAKLGMSRSQFSRLLGVSGATIGNWEGAPGRLNLHARSQDALAEVSALTKAQAWARLDRGGVVRDRGLA